MDYDPVTGVLFGIHNEGFFGSDRFLVTIDATDFSLPTSVSTEDGMDAIAFLPETAVGGEFLPIDSTALILAGAQTNAVWLMSALAVIGSVAFGALYIKSKKN